MDSVAILVALYFYWEKLVMLNETEKNIEAAKRESDQRFGNAWLRAKRFAELYKRFAKNTLDKSNQKIDCDGGQSNTAVYKTL